MGNGVPRRHEAKSLSIHSLLAFGNISIGTNAPPTAMAPRLDFRDKLEIMVGGEPDLFAALQWRYQLAPTLQGRNSDLQEVLNWAENGQDSISVRLISGGGGTGKTRLAAEAARLLRGRGWSAGFVPRHTSQATTIHTDLRKILMIFDYPEERMDVVHGLVQAIRDIPDNQVEFPIRILFVSRREFGEWSDVADSLGPRFGRHELASLYALDGDAAKAIYAETAAGFAKLLGRAAIPETGAGEWFAEKSDRRTPLVAMAAAIHQQITGRAGFGLGAPELIAALAKHEGIRARAVSITAGLGERGLPRLLALSALSDTGLSERQCRELGTLEATPLKGQALIDALANTPWWKRSELDGRMHLPRPEPDRMAAVFMGQALLEDASEALPDWIAVPAMPQGGSFGDTVGRIGFDLLDGRASWSRELEEALEIMLDKEPTRVDLLLNLADHEYTVFSSGFTSAILTRLLQRKGLDPQLRARILRQLTEAHLKVRRLEEALIASEEALALDRSVSKEFPNKHTRDLAESLGTVARVLNELGRSEDALAFAQESVDLCRQLANEKPELGRILLSWSLNILANVLGGQGREELALVTGQEAISLCHILAKDRPNQFADTLAMYLHNQAGTYFKMGRPEESINSIQEAVSIRQTLAKDKPDLFTPLLGTSLISMSNTLSKLGRLEEALDAAQEATDLYRVLAKARPKVFTSDLAWSLNTLANRFSGLGQPGHALEAIQEASTCYRIAAKAWPEIHTGHLASSLNNLALDLSKMGHHEEALPVAEEALSLRRALAEEKPHKFTPDLASSFNTLIGCLSYLGEFGKALTAAEEAVEIYRKLSNIDPEAYSPRFAMALGNLSNVLTHEGQHKKALDAAVEAVRLRRALASSRPAVFSAGLASSLVSLANSFRMHGRYDEALASAEEAVSLRTSLANDLPEKYVADLAEAQVILALSFHALDRLEEAHAIAEAATRNLSSVFLRRPSAYYQWMSAAAKVYIGSCNALNRSPDNKLLWPIFKKLEAFDQ